MIDLIYAICFREGGGIEHLEEFARELEQNHRLEGNIQENIMNMLQIPDGSFKICDVKKDSVLK